MDKTDPLTVDRLLMAVADYIWPDCDGERSAAVEQAQALLTPAARMSLIADLVSGLPHGDSPALELGLSVEGHALIRQMVMDGAQGMSSEHMDSNGIDYACVRIGGLWIGASKPKTEGK